MNRNSYRIAEYFSLPEGQRQQYALQIRQGDWRAAQYLHSLLETGAFHKQYGAEARLLLMVCGDGLMGFCTYAYWDEIKEDSLYPWAGFVYVFPKYRGRRYSQVLLEHACAIAKEEGHGKLWLTSNEIGLYEKYGFAPLGERITLWGGKTRLFCKIFENDTEKKLLPTDFM